MIITFDSKRNLKNRSNGNGSNNSAAAKHPVPLISQDPSLMQTHRSYNNDSFTPQGAVINDINSNSSSTTNSSFSRQTTTSPPQSALRDNKNSIIVDNSFDFNKQIKRSKNGCITCKFRKKKCDEGKPVCSACRRLNKKCVYADPDKMSMDEIKQLKSTVLKTESHLKLRRRRKSLLRLNDPFVDEQIHLNRFGGTNMNNMNMNMGLNLSERMLLNPNVDGPSIAGLIHPLILAEMSRNRFKGSDVKPTGVAGSSNSSSPNFPDISNLLNHLENDRIVNYMNENVNLNRAQEIPQGPQDVKHKGEMEGEDEEDEEEDNDDDEIDNDEDKIENRIVRSPSPDFFSYLKELSHEFSLNKFSDINDEDNKEKEEDHFNPLSPSFLTQQIVSANPSSPSFNVSQLLNSLTSPTPLVNPNILVDFPNNATIYYDYYVNVLSPAISVAPRRNSENFYQNVFLPLAHKDQGIMNSILAWSSFHMGKPEDLNEGSKYLKLALNHFHNMKITDKSSVINKLALLLICVAANLCKGDVKTWSTYLDWGFKILSNNGGIKEFSRNKEEFWLISNFAYHDVLSSDNVDRGTYFPNNQYNEIFHHDLSSGISHPLVGIAKDLISIIGYISSLAFETNQNLASLDDELNSKNISDSPTFTPHGSSQSFTVGEDEEGTIGTNNSELSNHARKNQILLKVKEKANELEHRIDTAKPNPDDLINLTDEEFEWQITLFETFKLSVKLYLRQSIFKCNPSTLESQILNNDLIKCLDIILGSPVESVLLFPVFISGIHCVSKLDRSNMTKRIDKFIQTYGPWSVIRGKEVIEKIWEINPDGDKVVDWHKILKDLGWEINFA